MADSRRIRLHFSMQVSSRIFRFLRDVRVPGTPVERSSNKLAVDLTALPRWVEHHGRRSGRYVLIHHLGTPEEISAYLEYRCQQEESRCQREGDGTSIQVARSLLHVEMNPRTRLG